MTSVLGAPRDSLGSHSTQLMIRTIFRTLRSITPKPIRKAAFRAARFLGSGLYPVYPSIDSALAYLREWGYSPRVALDIGAYHGEWMRQFRAIFPGARVLMVEGQPGKESILRDACALHPGEVEYVIALLGPRDGEMARFVEMETGSSVLEEASPYSRTYAERPLVRLDTLLERFASYAQPDFVKLDVQGYELEVLRGAAQALRSAEFVLMEASLIAINQGCPTLAEVIAFMTERDFQLLDFCSQSRLPNGALWQTDLLFISTRSSHLPKTTLR